VFGHRWEPAQATIVATHVKKTTGDGMVTIREFAADVVPSTGVPFRALIQEPRIATDFWAPSVGDVVRVLADVKRQRAKFDKADPAISAKAREDAAAEQFRETLAQPPGGPDCASQ
jgi:hypothetical protein